MVIKMYRIVKVKYHSIMINDDQKESVSFDANGTLYKNDKGNHLFFKSKEDIEFEISYTDTKLTLRQNNSILKFDINEILTNRYHTTYGDFLFEAKLLLLKHSEDGLKIKYELYQNNECVSKIYMQIGYYEYVG